MFSLKSLAERSYSILLADGNSQHVSLDPGI